RGLPPARRLRRLARAGRAGEHSSRGEHAGRGVRMATGELLAGGRLRGRRGHGAELMSSAAYRSSWTDDGVRMFRAAVRQFVQKEFVPNQARWRAQHRPDAEAWTAAGAAGLLL